MYQGRCLNNFYLLSALSIYTKSLFGGVSNNKIYLKNILRKTRTKKALEFFWNFLENQKFKDVLEEEEEEEEKFSFGP